MLRRRRSPLAEALVTLAFGAGDGLGAPALSSGRPVAPWVCEHASAPSLLVHWRCAPETRWVRLDLHGL